LASSSRCVVRKVRGWRGFLDLSAQLLLSGEKVATRGQK